jgi:hypothetical protein
MKQADYVVKGLFLLSSIVYSGRLHFGFRGARGRSHVVQRSREREANGLGQARRLPQLHAQFINNGISLTITSRLRWALESCKIIKHFSAG